MMLLKRIPTDIPLQTKEETAYLVGQAVKGERIALNKTQAEFAKLVELPVSRIRRLEQSGDISLSDFLSILHRISLDDVINSLFELRNERLKVKTAEYLDGLSKIKKTRVRKKTLFNSTQTSC